MMNKKKICFVAEYMFCGGTEKSMLSLMNCLDQRKYEVTLLLMKKKGDLLDKIPEWIHVEEINFPEDEKDDLLNGRTSAMKNAVKSGKILQAFKKAIRGIEMFVQCRNGAEKRLWYYQNIENKIEEYPVEFDVVIDYMGYGLFNTFYAAKKVKGKIKFSWVHFEPDNAMPDFYVFRDLLNIYDYIMCVSQNSMNQIHRMIPELSQKCRVFYNIINKEELYEQAREVKINKPTERILLLSVGRLDPQKGFDVGIEVINRLIQNGYPVEWWIIGEGWQRKELEEKILQCTVGKEYIKLLGQKLNPYPYFAMCDIYFMPSRHEGYGIVLAEAKAFNKPVVVTDFAGAREQIINRKTGIITKFDEKELYISLKEMIENSDLRKTITNNLKLEQNNGKIQLEILEKLMEQTR